VPKFCIFIRHWHRIFNDALPKRHKRFQFVPKDERPELSRSGSRERNRARTGKWLDKSSVAIRLDMA
jgi:hypothetical protein